MQIGTVQDVVNVIRPEDVETSKSIDESVPGAYEVDMPTETPATVGGSESDGAAVISV